MRAILKKTVGARFRAGDIITGENYRIKRLVEQNVAVPDHSLTAMAGNIFSFVFSLLMLTGLIIITIPSLSRFVPFEIPLIWNITLMALLLVSFSMNMAYFQNVKKPYLTIFLGYITNILSGILVLIGQERMARKYQPKTMSSMAGTTLLMTGTMALSIMILSIVDANLNLFVNYGGFQGVIMFTLYITIITGGIVAAIIFDRDYVERRKRFINFLKRSNAKIAYKHKAIRAYKAYLNTGNAKKFLEENIDLLEGTLGVDKKSLEDL